MGNNLDSALVSLAATFEIATGEHYRLQWLQSEGKGLLYVWGDGGDIHHEFTVKHSEKEDILELLEEVWGLLKECYANDLIEQGRI